MVESDELNQHDEIPARVKPLLSEFTDVFPTELPTGLPPIRGIEHQIDLVPGSVLPNKAAYRCSPHEAKELEKQVNELVAKGYFQICWVKKACSKLRFKSHNHASESLRHCKWVDEVIPDAPWVMNQEFIDKHQIDYVAHDSLPYADASGAGNDVYEFVKSIGRFKETKRTEGISTSDIIMRIVKDYNNYVMRNLDRGYSRKDLGVSYVKVG
ncbi:uncharacterized protein [Rutidosis leptorrhynchoides]|uniref:uncharacterized protein n=1 Tax=Rutidosis leptorrhynchoides TaxID=125765 RepID=UPI003A9979EC